MRSILLSISAALLLIGYLIFGLKDPPTKKTIELQISSIKIAAQQHNPTPFSKLLQLKENDIITVKGYLIGDEFPMLVSDIKYYQVNSPMPDSTFIVLAGEGADFALKKSEKYFGAYVEFKLKASDIKRNAGPKKGKEFVVKNYTGTEFEPILFCNSIPKILLKRKPGLQIPTNWSICKSFPEYCKHKPHKTSQNKKWALLYCSSDNESQDKSRYWNDMKFMYLTLIRNGFDSSNIVVVYKTGTQRGGDRQIPVHFPASIVGFDGAINALKSKMTNKDLFFFYVTGHGLGTDTTHKFTLTPPAYGARQDEGLDEIDTGVRFPYLYDETFFYYGERDWDNTLWDDSLKAKINTLSYNKMIALFQPCFSGGLFYDLKSPKNIILSASSEFEFSWDGGPDDHDLFSYHFISALNKATNRGIAINSDTDEDGHVSILEAFLYAKSLDNNPETPLLDDAGDGVGQKDPSTIATSKHGRVAASTHID